MTMDSSERMRLPAILEICAMKSMIAVVFGVMVTAFVGTAVGRGPNSGDKPPLVVSGYVTRIDLKKKDLTVHGSEVTPAGTPQKSTAHSSFQEPGGGRGGGGSRGGASGGRGGGAGRGNRAPEEAAQDFSVKVSPDTMIQTDKGALTLNDLRVQDYVVVLGTLKGKSINASSISVSIR
jgi:hypothetical protein